MRPYFFAGVFHLFTIHQSAEKISISESTISSGLAASTMPMALVSRPSTWVRSLPTVTAGQDQPGVAVLGFHLGHGHVESVPEFLLQAGRHPALSLQGIVAVQPELEPQDSDDHVRSNKGDRGESLL